MEKLKVEVVEEINDAQVMLDWWNESFRCSSYSGISVSSVTDEGRIAFSAYNGIERIELSASVDDFKSIDGVLSVEYVGNGNYKVAVAREKNMEDKKKKKVYPVEISETRVITIFVEADSESAAQDRAESLHESSDEICEMLNDPTSNVDANVNVYDPVEPKEGDRVW